MRHHVLVVEDEPSLLRGILRGLEQQPDLRTTGCTSVEEAIPVLHNDPPELMVTDISLPGRPGLDLVGELDAIGLLIPVIVVTAFRAACDSQIPSRTTVKVLEKPVPIKTLRKMIADELELQAPRPVQAFQVADYLQIAGIGRYSVVLHATVDGGETGVLEVVEGNIWNAYLGDEIGEDAVAAMIRCTTHSVATRVMEHRPKGRQIQRSWEAVLLDMARVHDESRRPPPPAEASEPEVPIEDRWELDEG